MIELPSFSAQHELLRLHRRLLDVIDSAIPVVLLMLIWLSVLVTLLGGR